jgi:hypothetical protein
MKMIGILALALVLGCETTTTTVDHYPPDAAPEVDAGPDAPCPTIQWQFGGNRWCDQCVCPGTECRMSSEEGVTVGVCGEDLECSTPCTDPLWLEMVDAGTIPGK